MSYKFADGFRAGLGRSVLILLASCNCNLYDIHLLLCVLWKTPDDRQRNCPKYVEFYSKDKFEKLVHLIAFIIRIYHDARSPELSILYLIGETVFFLRKRTNLCHPAVANLHWHTITNHRELQARGFWATGDDPNGFSDVFVNYGIGEVKTNQTVHNGRVSACQRIPTFRTNHFFRNVGKRSPKYTG